MVDSISHGVGLSVNSRLATSFYNPLAAMPSLHCGCALAVSIAGARYARHRATRAVAVAWTPVVVLSVLATGNQFVLEMLAGLTLTCVGAWVSSRLAGGLAPALEGRVA